MLEFDRGGHGFGWMNAGEFSHKETKGSKFTTKYTKDTKGYSGSV